MRKLVPLILAPLLLPAVGYPLGLGEIRLHSGLNQALSADIELLSVSAEDAQTLKVGLASSDMFAQLGIDRSSALSQLNFSVAQHPDGTYYVKAESKQAIREPFLDFLLEVNWSSGRLLREYTVLLDPPQQPGDQALAVEPPAPVAESNVEQAAAAPMAPVNDVSTSAGSSGNPAAEATQKEDGTGTASANAEGAAAQGTPEAAKPDDGRANASTEGARAAEQKSSEPGAQPPRTAQESEKPKEPPAASEPARKPAAVHHAPRVVTYGPVRKHETLSQIAARLRPGDSVTLNQVMVALLRSNPKAFIRKNVNLLKAGHVLRLDPAKIAAISREEATRQVAMQGREWEDYRRQAAQQAASRTPSGPTATERSTAIAKKDDEPRLKLVAPQEGAAAKKGKQAGTGVDSKDADAIRKELMLAIETTEAQKQENGELRKRLKELEGQMTSMQRLLSLKDNDLASLQRELDAAKTGKSAKSPANGKPAQSVAAHVPGQSAADSASAPATPTQSPKGAGAAPGADTKTPEGDVVLPVPNALKHLLPSDTASTNAQGAASKPADSTAPAANAQGAPSKAADSTAASANVQGTAPKRAAKPTIRPFRKPPQPATPVPLAAPQQSIFSELLENPIVQGGAAFVALLLGILALIIVRRRRGSSFQESILMGGTPSMLKSKTSEASSKETSFFSDFAVSGMGGVHAAEDSEVDPLTEADVYMAYQRHQQAEELLREALKHSDRPELRAKLLEVLHATRNDAEFEKEAIKLKEKVRGRGPLWDKVVAIGAELMPDNALFGGGGAKGGTSHDARLDSEVLDIGLDLDALAEPPASTPESNGGFNVDLGVDFSDIDAQLPAQGAAAEEPQDAAGAGGFNLGDLDLGFEEPPSHAAEESSAGPGASLDFGDLNLGEDTGSAASASTHDDGELQIGGIDFGQLETGPDAPLEFGDLNLGEDTGSAASTSTHNDGELQIGDMDFGQLELDHGTDPQPSMGDTLRLDSQDSLGESLQLGDLNELQLDASSEGDDALFASLDETGTKLDLARAYVEMGDADGARSILDEVMHEGNADQKQHARQLLQQLA